MFKSVIISWNFVVTLTFTLINFVTSNETFVDALLTNGSVLNPLITSVDTNQSITSMKPTSLPSEITYPPPIHPWLPIGNFTGILSGNQSYNDDSYNVGDGLPAQVLAYQIEDQDVLSMYKIIDETENNSNNINNSISNNSNSDNNRPSSNNNLDESFPSFFDDSPTKEEDYAGGNYGGNDDNDSSLGGVAGEDGNLNDNLISSSEDEKLT